VPGTEPVQSGDRAAAGIVDEHPEGFTSLLQRVRAPRSPLLDAVLEQCTPPPPPRLVLLACCILNQTYAWCWSNARPPPGQVLPCMSQCDSEIGFVLDRCAHPARFALTVAV
jgi:hypothetical protein